ncbi:MAG: capsule assembly Wzi family protein [Gemmatimonadetes bacterium]|nr:capsule assembly Wzi family protein [Gemmatimonadota bacterium]
MATSRRHPRWCATLLVLTLALGNTASAPAQERRPELRRAFESYPLPADHWAVRAAERAEALGLAPEYLHAHRTVPFRIVGLALRGAVGRAEADHPELADLARGWYERFTREFPSFERQLNGGEAPVSLTRAEGRVGIEASAGQVNAGTGLAPGQTGATDRSGPEGALASLRLAAQVGGVAALYAAPVLRIGDGGGGDGGQGAGDGLWSGEWSASVGGGPLSVRLGRGRLLYGFGEGGVVFGGNESIDKLELESRAPIRIPGLRFLGPLAFHTSLSRLDEPRHSGRPWLLATSGILRPHARVDLELNRGFFFGGDDVEITAGRLARMLVGQQGGGAKNATFANQVAAFAGRWRLPSEALIPTTAYVEWGMDDGSGAWSQVPGVVIGAFVPALPGFPDVALGVEHASFTSPCCGHPVWYRHGAFRGGWVLDDLPAGHELGGDGAEGSVYTRAHLLGSRLFIDGRLFLRSRGPENLFAPGREGDSGGYRLRASFLARRRLELGVEAFQDSGDDWTERSILATVSHYF